MKKILFNLIALSLLVTISQSCKKSEPSVADQQPSKLKALIIDGQNNHGIWPKTTAMMKDYLEQTGLFTVDIARTAFTWQGPHNDRDVNFSEKERLELLKKYPAEKMPVTTMVSEATSDPNFKPDFSAYDVVISNFGWMAAEWPKETQSAMEMYVSNGGGFILLHAADNSFGKWEQFNRIIGMGAWGDRNEKNGPYVYLDDAGKVVRDTTAGPAGSHGTQYPFLITVRDSNHPITSGMPTQWLHAQDELYDRLRGPAENMNILASAYSDKVKNDSPFSDLSGTNHHEPMMMTVDYGKGRVFHTTLGHTYYSLECVGFITMFQRAAEWAATGKVTTAIPDDFPTADSVKQRKWNK